MSGKLQAVARGQRAHSPTCRLHQCACATPCQSASDAARARTKTPAPLCLLPIMVSASFLAYATAAPGNPKPARHPPCGYNRHSACARATRFACWRREIFAESRQQFDMTTVSLLFSGLRLRLHSSPR